MSTSNSKSTKTKSNSHKKLRKSIRDTEVLDNSKLSAECNNGTQTIDNKEHSGKKSDSSKSLENIMNLKNVNHDTISMSKTDISIVYGMYKTLLQKTSGNNEAHIENYQVLLNELHKLQSQLNEQELGYKSLVHLVKTLASQQRMDRRMHRKRSDKVNKMMILKLSQISSVIYKLQCSIESFETKSLALDLKIDESATATNLETLQKKNKKKSTFCCCIQ